MKKYAIYGILLLVLLSSCKKKLTEFEIDYTAEVVVPSTLGQALPFSLYTPEITTNSEYEFEVNDTRKDKINSIFLKDLTLTITSPSGETFSFLNSIEVYIKSPNAAEKRVAYKENIPSGIGSVLICDLVYQDIQEFIKDDTFTLRLETVTDETIPQDVHIEVYSNFLVDASLL